MAIVNYALLPILEYATLAILEYGLLHRSEVIDENSPFTRALGCHTFRKRVIPENVGVETFWGLKHFLLFQRNFYC